MNPEDTSRQDDDTKRRRQSKGGSAKARASPPAFVTKLADQDGALMRH